MPDPDLIWQRARLDSQINRTRSRRSMDPELHLQRASGLGGCVAWNWY